MTIEQLDALAEGREPVRTHDILLMSMADVAYLCAHIEHHNHSGSYFLKQVIQRVDRWGLRFSKKLYSKRLEYPTVILDTEVYLIILGVCYLSLALAVAVLPMSWVSAFCFIMLLVCIGASHYLIAQGGDRLEVAYKNTVYKRVTFDQCGIALKATNQYIPYAHITALYMSDKNMHIITNEDTYSIVFTDSDKDVNDVAEYIKIRSNIHEQQARGGSSDKEELISSAAVQTLDGDKSST